MSWNWGSWERRRHISGILSFLWFSLRDRTLEFGPDYSGGTRQHPRSFLGIRPSLCVPAPWHFLSGHPFFTSVLSPPPPSSFGAFFELSADSCFVSSCKLVNIISGFLSPRSFPSGEGAAEPLYSEEKFSILRVETAPRAGLPTRSRWLLLWVLKCSNTTEGVRSCITVFLVPRGILSLVCLTSPFFLPEWWLVA